MAVSLSEEFCSPQQRIEREWIFEVCDSIFPDEESILSRWLDLEQKLHSEERDCIQLLDYPSDGLGEIVCDQWVPPNVREQLIEKISELQQGHLGLVVDNVAIYHFSALRKPHAGKLILVSLSTIQLIINELYTQPNLNSSELRLAVLVSMNYSLREAAILDGQAYETKRSQIKIVYQKLNLNRQAEVGQVLLVNILSNFWPRTHSPNKQGYCLATYVDTYLPNTTRSHIIAGANGVQNRYLDFGPINGRPIVYLHHLGLVYFTDNDIDQLHELNLRLICPMRNGALEPEEKSLSLSDQLSHANQSVEVVRKLFFGDKISVACPLNGVFYGMEYSRCYPRNVENLIFIGACYKDSESKSPANNVRNYALKIALNRPWILDKLLSYVASRSKETNYLRNLFLRSHSDSPVDYEYGKLVFKDEKFDRAYQYRVSHSLSSIKHDLHLQADQNWQNIGSVVERIHFIHGIEDGVNPINIIESFVDDLPNAELHPVDGAGSMVHQQKTSEVFQLLSSIVS